jgi:hypothetical protein
VDSAVIFVMAGGLFAIFAWAIILLNWRVGVWALLVYATTMGLVVVAMFAIGLGALALVTRDILIIAPLYISLFLFGGKQPYHRIPWHVSAACAFFAFVVLADMGNPGVPNLLVALIGAKVWLCYIPLLYVGAVFIKTERQLLSVVRTIVGMAWVAWTLGIAQYIGAMTIGFEPTMRFLFGGYGELASGGFSCFDFGALFCRLPGSFTFSSQYGSFCVFMLFPLFMLITLETDRTWRGFAQLSFAMALIAGLTSGARGNFILLPAAVMLIYFLRFRLKGGVQMVLGLAVAGVVVFNVIGIDAGEAYGTAGKLSDSYSRDLVVGGFADGLAKGGILGQGTGTNTGPARHAFDDAAAMAAEQGYYIENFMAKTLAELGVIGFLALMILFGFLGVHLLQGQFSCRQPRLKDCAATVTAMVAFTLATSVKGWALDSDPINFYFYFFVGLGFAIPHLDRSSAPMQSRVAEAGPVPVAGQRYVPRSHMRAGMDAPKYDGRDRRR